MICFNKSEIPKTWYPSALDGCKKMKIMNTNKIRPNYTSYLKFLYFTKCNSICSFSTHKQFCSFERKFSMLKRKRNPDIQLPLIGGRSQNNEKTVKFLWLMMIRLGKKKKCITEIQYKDFLTLIWISSYHS